MVKKKKKVVHLGTSPLEKQHLVSSLGFLIASIYSGQGATEADNLEPSNSRDEKYF